MACCFTVDEVRSKERRTMVSLGRYRRLSDFVSASLAFLRSNYLLRAMLVADELRPKPAAPWHGVPVMGALYAHLNRLQRDHDEILTLLTSAPAAPLVHLANLWIEGGTVRRYGVAGAGMGGLAMDLAAALGDPAARDFPTADEAFAAGLSLVDTEAGVIVCAFDVDRARKRFLDGAAGLLRGPRGRLLPVLIVQGRLAVSEGYAAMDDAERTAWFEEMGYAVRTVETGLQFEARLYSTLEWAWHNEDASAPLIVLKVPRSLTMPAPLSTLLDREPDAFLFRIREDEALLDAFRGWLDGYQSGELVESDGQPDKDILALCPSPERRVATMRAQRS